MSFSYYLRVLRAPVFYSLAVMAFSSQCLSAASADQKYCYQIPSKSFQGLWGTSSIQIFLNQDHKAQVLQILEGVSLSSFQAHASEAGGYEEVFGPGSVKTPGEFQQLLRLDFNKIKTRVSGEHHYVRTYLAARDLIEFIVDIGEGPLTPRPKPSWRIQLQGKRGGLSLTQTLSEMRERAKTAKLMSLFQAGIYGESQSRIGEFNRLFDVRGRPLGWSSVYRLTRYVVSHEDLSLEISESMRLLYIANLSHLFELSVEDYKNFQKKFEAAVPATFEYLYP